MPTVLDIIIKEIQYKKGFEWLLQFVQKDEPQGQDNKGQNIDSIHYFIYSGITNDPLCIIYTINQQISIKTLKWDNIQTTTIDLNNPNSIQQLIKAIQTIQNKYETQIQQLADKHGLTDRRQIMDHISNNRNWHGQFEN